MQELSQLINQAQQTISQAPDFATLEQLRVQWLGKKGVLTERLKQLGNLPAEQRPQVGQAVNVWINGKLITALEKVS